MRRHSPGRAAQNARYFALLASNAPPHHRRVTAPSNHPPNRSPVRALSPSTLGANALDPVALSETL
jgi:hypothetical protein